MKPKNFEGRKMMRRVRAYQAKFVDGVLQEQSHEVFALHSKLPAKGERGCATLPEIKDIRFRLGRKNRDNYGRGAR